MKHKVLVAMSGGVDSSVAALLLHEAGWDVAGVTMCLGLSAAEDKARCCGGDAIADARRVCDRLGIPHQVLNLSREMEEEVIARFAREYAHGRTPNPCADCNRYLKFGSLLRKAAGMGFDYLATGHYAAIEEIGGSLSLCRALDRAKDQSYFLFGIPRETLPRLIFPLAALTKSETRRKAREAGLPVAEKAESQDLCFVASGAYHALLEGSVGSDPGPITDPAGNVLGRHRGLIRYTVGQRDGLGIAVGRPLYVLRIEAETNRLVVGGKEDTVSHGLMAGDLNLLQTSWGSGLEVVIRHRGQPVPCTTTLREDRLEVRTEAPLLAVAPGQAAVLYRGDIVVGGGTIDAAIP